MIPLRQPLPSATVRFPFEIRAELLQILMQETNVDEIHAYMPSGYKEVKRKHDDQ